MNLEYYKGKVVLITGHTGFKGSWLSKILVGLGAKVIGYSHKPREGQNLFELSKVEKDITSIIGDVRDYDKLLEVFKKYKPEIVFHLAAQPLVLESYKEPRYTYETNVMGTINVLECVRNTDSVKKVINITTDKVYQNPENGIAFIETDRLNGYDPYSNSKSCSELVTECYYKSFLKEKNITVVTMRAGNVIGGGDFAENRIVPDCVRAYQKKEDIILKNPTAVRPFQHVLEPLFAYLLVGTKEYSNIEHFNIGPQKNNHVTTEKLVQLFCKKMKNVNYVIQTNKNQPHEANLLVLNCHKIRKELKWKPLWNINKTIEKICDFYKAKDIPKEMEKEINDYIKEYTERM